MLFKFYLITPKFPEGDLNKITFVLEGFDKVFIDGSNLKVPFRGFRGS